MVSFSQCYVVLNKCTLLFAALSNSTVGLQLESGERLVKEFPSSASLWDVLTHWDSDQDRLEELIKLSHSTKDIR